MKKIMITIAVVCAAAFAQAASSSWKVMGGNFFDGSGSTAADAKFSGSAYVFSTAIISQSALFDAYFAANAANQTYDFAGKSAGTVTINNGAVSSSANTFEYGDVGTTYDMYFVLINDNQDIYFSNILTGKSALNPPNVGSLSFGTQNNNSTTFSALAPAGEGFQGAGHWSAVPEPTSGLLMLVGLAGLALRRRRA